MGKLTRVELQRRLAQLPARQKLAALIDSANAQRAVRAMPAEDLYFAIAEVGLADASDIVQLASPLQFRTFVDLGGWKRDRIDPHQVLTWLRAARGDDDDDFRAKFHALDFEVLEYLLRSFTVVHDLEENPDVNPEGATLETPEGRYLLEFSVEGVEFSAMRALVNELIAENPFEAIRFMEAARWDLPAELQETAYRFRSARLSDLGFPELYDALSLFTFVDPDKARSPGASSSTALAVIERVDFLRAAIDSLTDVERNNLEDELRYLVNAALVADGAEPGDLDAVRRVSEQSRDTLSLGLEHLSATDPSRAADVVRDKPLKYVFQIGFSLTLRLKFRADALAKEPLAKIDGVDLLLPEESAAVLAIRRKRPLRALKVEGAEPVAFRSLKEIADAGALLDRAQSQQRILRALLGGTAESSAAALERLGGRFSEIRPERLFDTVVCQAVLEGANLTDPVPAERLGELCGRLLDPSTRERVSRVLAGSADSKDQSELNRMVERSLKGLVASLGPPYTREGRIDPKLVVDFIIAGQPIL